MYCPICDCPFEDVLQNTSSEGGYNTTISLPSQTKCLANFRVICKSTFTHDTETSKTPFGVSPPAHVAEFRCCFIEGRNSYGFEFSCWEGKRWQLLEKRALGSVLYPLHQTCIETVRRVAQYNRLCNAPHNTVDHTSLQGYYEALLRLHDPLTSWPYDDPGAEEQLSRFMLIQPNVVPINWNGSISTMALHDSLMDRVGVGNLNGRYDHAHRTRAVLNHRYDTPLFSCGSAWTHLLSLTSLSTS